jgi:peptidoglycan/LPS O-acetylase OafA/YrhL
MVDKITALLPFGLDWMVAFSAYPAFHWDSPMPGMNHAWTLGAELTFYILAPWLLRSRWPVVIAFLLSVATRVWFVHAMGHDDRWTYMFAPSTFLFFLLGHFVQSASQHMGWLRRGRVGAGLLLVSILFQMVPRYTDWDSLRFWIATLAFALSLPGVFHGTKNVRLSNMLGELSYPIYLVHSLVLIQLTQIFWFELPVRVFGTGRARALSAGAIGLSFFVVLSVVGFLLQWPIEKPASKGLRWVLDQAVPRATARPVALPVPIAPD